MARDTARASIRYAGGLSRPNDRVFALHGVPTAGSVAPVQVRAGQVRVVQVAQVQVRAGQLAPVRFRIDQASRAQVRAGQVRAASSRRSGSRRQVRAWTGSQSGQVSRSRSVRAGQVRAGQVRFSRVRGRVSVSHVAGQVRAGQVRVGQVRADQVIASVQVRAGQVRVRSGSRSGRSTPRGQVRRQLRARPSFQLGGVACPTSGHDTAPSICVGRRERHASPHRLKQHSQQQQPLKLARRRPSRGVSRAVRQRSRHRGRSGASALARSNSPRVMVVQRRAPAGTFAAHPTS